MTGEARVSTGFSRQLFNAVRSVQIAPGGSLMSRLSHWLILAVFTSAACLPVAAEGLVSDANTVCNFDPEKQIAVDYEQVHLASGKKASAGSVPYGRVWAPGGKPLTLFTNTPVTIGEKTIADGAYTMFIIPEEKSWTLVVSNSTDTSGKYDESRDVARIPMQFGKLPQAEPAFTAYFAHVAPNQCNLRLDLGQARAWVVFERK
jgi:hypothetical protein